MALGAGLFVASAQAQFQEATEYFRPWLSALIDSNLSNDWTDPHDPPNNAEGKSMIIYVSSVTGVDGPNTPANLKDGGTFAAPYATIARAWQALDARRSGSNPPVHASIRLMRGSVFVDQVLTPDVANLGQMSGMSAAQPLVIEAWPRPGSGVLGDDDPRPKLLLPINNSTGRGTAEAWFMSGSGSEGSNIMVMGLEVFTKPMSIAGQEWPPVAPVIAFQKTGSGGKNFLFEDLYIHDVQSAFAIDGNDPQEYITGITVRRCVIERCYHRDLRFGRGDPESSEAGGGYFAGSKWVLIEDNFMNEVGWSPFPNHPLVVTRTPLWEEHDKVVAAGLQPKTVYNHGLYLPASSDHVLVRNNVIAFPSHNALQSRGNRQRIENNLVLCAPVGISLGHAQNQGKPGSEYSGNHYPAPICPCVPEPCCFYVTDPVYWPAPCTNSSTVCTYPCAYYPYFWRGTCRFNVIVNGANVDRWQVVTLPSNVCQQNGAPANCVETKIIEVDESPRGRGLTISRSRSHDRNGASFDYCEPRGNGTLDRIQAADVYRNLIMNNDDGREPTAGGIFVDDDQDSAPNPDWIWSYQATIRQNIVYHWTGAAPNGSFAVSIQNDRTGSGPKPPFMMPAAQGPLGDGFVFEGNHFVQTGIGKQCRARWNTVGGKWSGNQYYSEAPGKYLVKLPGPALSDPAIPATYLGTNGWREAVRNATTNTTESLSESLSSPSYPDANRTLFSYLVFESSPPIHDPIFKSQINTTQVYMTACSTLRRGKWNPQLEAKSVNNYLRAGFGLIHQESPTCEE